MPDPAPPPVDLHSITEAAIVRTIVSAPLTTLVLINESTILSDAEVHKIHQALIVQVVRDFYPFWGVYVRIVFLPKGSRPPANAWQLTFLDDSDQANALGYHDVTPAGLPLGKIFVQSTLADGGKVSVTASHELLEMLGDPEINLTVLSADNRRLYAYENCDAVELDSLGYDINNVTVSDFVTPAWFGGLQGPYDFKGHLNAPFQLAPGGYISILDLSSPLGWQQIFADSAKRSYAMRAPIGSRRERRRITKENWAPSTTPIGAEE
jgi:hypothetical protein